MADYFSFPAELPDLSRMDRPALAAALEDVRARITQLDLQEPEDMESEEYELWGQRHEELEDLADDLLDLLEDQDV